MSVIVPDFLYLPEDAYRPAVPTFTCSEACRSPEHLRKVVAQLDVVNTRRYAPRLGDTFCNVFVWDVTAALGAEVPHWVAADGSPCAMGKGSETTANLLPAWLRGPGHDRGWREVPGVEAELAANLGCPALVTYRNPHGHGHCAVLLDGGVIAQAGERNFVGESLSSGFGSLPVVYFVHP